MRAAIFAWSSPVLGWGLLFLSLAGGAQGQPCRWPTVEWETAAPETQGVDSSLLQAAFDHIERDLPNVFSLVVVHNGCLVAERYFRSHDESYSQTVASVTKSFTSAVLGIAIGEGRFPGVASRFSELLPSAFLSIQDTGKRQISVEDALTMTTGLAWDENTMFPACASSVACVLAQPLQNNPGEVFLYSTGNAELVSAALTASSGETVADYAQSALLEPLGIARPSWPTDADGNSAGGFGLVLTPRQMAKLGYLYLRGGVWDGRQIVPADWVAVSTRPHSGGGFPEYTTYAYYWWTTEEVGYPAFFAAGYGGQYVYVVPALDLVVVLTSDVTVPRQAITDDRHVVREFIAPAVRAEARAPIYAVPRHDATRTVER